MRFIYFAITLLLVFTGSRALVRALPGDPVESIIAESGTSIPPDVIRKQFGLDRPFFPALAEDLKKVTHGDLGQSLITRLPVTPLLLRRLCKTLELAACTLFFALSLSLSLGLIAAPHPGSLTDLACTTLGALTAALPTPWMGPILLYLFAIIIPIFPVGGGVLLSSLTLALSFSGLWARMIRERVRETLIRGAAPGARARGIPEWKILIKYGLAPSSGVLISYLGTQVGALLAGSFITEVIFNWQGMGSLFIESVLRRDYPLVEGATLFAAFFSLLGNFLGDQGRAWMDPKA